MRFACVAVALVAMAAPACAAEDLTPLYPENAVAVLGVDVAEVVKSPLGKKVVGADKPFTAARKLLGVFLEDGALKFSDNVHTHFADLANKLERVTVVAAVDLEGKFDLGVVAFLEGPNTEAEYVKGAEAFAKAEGEDFAVEKRGDRKVLSWPNGKLHGALARKGLFVVADKPEALAAVLDAADGKGKIAPNKQLVAAVKGVKPADTPIWFALAHEKLGGGTATIALKGDADFRLDYDAGASGFGFTVKSLLSSVFDGLAKKDTPQGRVWGAAKVEVKGDDKAVTATGTFPGKLIAEEYAKRK